MPTTMSKSLIYYHTCIKMNKLILLREFQLQGEFFKV